MVAGSARRPAGSRHRLPLSEAGASGGVVAGRQLDRHRVVLLLGEVPVTTIRGVRSVYEPAAESAGAGPGHSMGAPLSPGAGPPAGASGFATR